MAQPFLVNGDAFYYMQVQQGKKPVKIIRRESLTINKKEVEAVEGGLYSKELGSLIDVDADIRDCSCECQHLKGNFYEGQICPLCNTVVSKTFFPNLEKIGWIDLENFYVMSPEGWTLITSIIPVSKLEKIINVDYSKSLSIEGTFIKSEKTTKANQFDNIGLENFRKRFDEIIMFYANKKKERYQDALELIKMKNRLFTSKIMVYSSYLRPVIKSTKQNRTDYDPINRCYSVIATNAEILKRNKDNISKISIPSLLFTIQKMLVELNDIVIKTKISGKKRLTRAQVLGGRTCWSMRSVIVPLLDNSFIGCDNIIISYKAFLEIYYFEILNILINGYQGCPPKFLNMTPPKIESYIQRAQYSNNIDEDLYNLMIYLINNHEDGLWMLVSRPPILELGSSQFLKIVHVLKDASTYALFVPISSLVGYNGDFDGDALSAYSPKERRVTYAFREGLRPSKLMIDRSGDRLFNTDFGIYPEVSPTVMNFLRRDDEIL